MKNWNTSASILTSPVPWRASLIHSLFMPPSWKPFSGPQESEQDLRNSQQACGYPHRLRLVQTATAKAWVDAVPFKKKADLLPGSATGNHLGFVKNTRSLAIHSTETTCYNLFKKKENAELPVGGQRGSGKKAICSAVKLTCSWEKKIKGGLMNVTPEMFCSLSACWLLFQQMKNGVYLDQKNQKMTYTKKD